MTLSDNTLLIRKGDGPVKDSLLDFGMATGEIPWPAVVSVKDPGTVECPGEHGERAFFPDSASFEAYDLQVEFKHRASLGQLYANYKAFRDYLTKDGTCLSIYSPYCGVGRGKVRIKEISDVKFRKDNVGEYASFDVVFRVTDPVTDVTLSRSPQS